MGDAAVVADDTSPSDSEDQKERNREAHRDDQRLARKRHRRAGHRVQEDEAAK